MTSTECPLGAGLGGCGGGWLRGPWWGVGTPGCAAFSGGCRHMSPQKSCGAAQIKVTSKLGHWWCWTHLPSAGRGWTERHGRGMRNGEGTGVAQGPQPPAARSAHDPGRTPPRVLRRPHPGHPVLCLQPAKQLHQRPGSGSADGGPLRQSDAPQPQVSPALPSVPWLGV